MGYQNRSVLVTGGLGFIGSNLAIRLARGGAKVTVVDSSVKGCGANWHNLDPVLQDICVLPLDLAEAAEFRDAIRESDIIFNLAGEISHIHSMKLPERDGEINAAAHLRFLQEVVDHAPGVRIVYASTRQIYGVPRYLPVDELHPIDPVDFNGIHNYSATMYHLLWTRSGHLDAAILCLTNVYGPRMALNVPCQGVLSHFVRRAVMREPLKIFGDGAQLRDPLYVDDAVEAFLTAGDAPRLSSRIFNVGGPAPLPMADIASIASRAGGSPPPQFVPFPPELKAIDIGSYYTDSSLIARELGWCPTVSFEDGVARTIEFYRRELPQYLPDPNPVCRLEEAHVPRRPAPAAA